MTGTCQSNCIDSRNDSAATCGSSSTRLNLARNVLDSTGQMISRKSKKTLEDLAGWRRLKRQIEDAEKRARAKLLSTCRVFTPTEIAAYETTRLATLATELQTRRDHVEDDFGHSRSSLLLEDAQAQERDLKDAIVRQGVVFTD